MLSMTLNIPLIALIIRAMRAPGCYYRGATQKQNTTQHNTTQSKGEPEGERTMIICSNRMLCAPTIQTTAQGGYAMETQSMNEG